MVREFHERFRLPMSDVPHLVPDNLHRQRHQLLLSEVTELYYAMLKHDVVNVAQELADCVYVLYGTSLCYGIDLDAVVAEVHASNMTKLGADGKPIVNDAGKVLKGPNYVKPDVAGILARQAQDTL